MEIIYKPNKKKLVITFVTLSVFIILEFFIIINSDIIANYHFARSLGILGKPITIQIIGIFGVIFLLLYSIGILNIFFSKYGLVVTEKGFINNTSITNPGLILWDDIIGIKSDIGKYGAIVFVYLKNEKKYLNRIKNPIVKLNALIYNKTYKTSFVIDKSRLTITEGELLEIFKKYAKL